jgi:hypothetical protein
MVHKLGGKELRRLKKNKSLQETFLGFLFVISRI